MNAQNRKCTYCEQELFGRSDKKFCSTKCKSQYHYERSLKNLYIVKEVNKELLNDYKISLDILGGRKEAIAQRLLLLEKGLSFKRMTHIDTETYLGNQYLGLYDLCIIKLENGNYKITRNHEPIKL